MLLILFIFSYKCSDRTTRERSAAIELNKEGRKRPELDCGAMVGHGMIFLADGMEGA